jgi:hypothetical protein
MKRIGGWHAIETYPCDPLHQVDGKKPRHFCNDLSGGLIKRNIYC